MRIVEMCKDIKVDKIIEVKVYACLPQVTRPEVKILKDTKQAQEVIESYKPEQVNIYVNALVQRCKAGIRIYTTPSQVYVLKVVVRSNQVDIHLAELLAINKVANWPWSPSCIASDDDGYLILASSI